MNTEESIAFLFKWSNQVPTEESKKFFEIIDHMGKLFKEGYDIGFQAHADKLQQEKINTWLMDKADKKRKEYFNNRKGLTRVDGEK